MDEAQTLADYRRLSWTRLISVERFSSNLDRLNDLERAAGLERAANTQSYSWPLGPDIVEECNAVAALPAVDPDEWAPLFEPDDFNKAHGPLKVESFRLP